MAEIDIEAERTKQFHEQGYLTPFRICSREKMEQLRERVDDELLSGDETPTPGAIPAHFHRHLDSEFVYELCRSDPLIERTTDIYGQDLMLWSTKFWEKVPGAKEVPWHQHYHHMGHEPPITLTAWIAFTEVMETNGALQLIPSSHSKIIREVESPGDKALQTMTDPEQFEEEFSKDDVITVEMEPGECLLFNERMFHRSPPNTSDVRRLALSARISVPFVYFNTEKVGGNDENGFTTAMMLHGEDRHGINRMISPPVKK